MTTTATKGAAAFDADLRRFNDALQAADAVVTDPDGFQWIDRAKVPDALLSAYHRLLCHGYANGMIP